MSKESERAVSLQDCVDYYAKTGSHDLYMEQIDRCQSRRALLFRLLKSFFQRVGMETEAEINAFCSDKTIRKSEWLYGAGGSSDKVTGMTWHNWKYGKNIPERASLIQMAFYLGLNGADADRLLKRADHRGLYARDFRDLTAAFYLNQGFQESKGAVPDTEEAEERMLRMRNKIRLFREKYLEKRELVYDAARDIWYYTGKLDADIPVNQPIKNISEEIYRTSVEKTDMAEEDFEQFLSEHIKELEIRRMGAIHIMEKYMSDRGCFFKYLEDSEKYRVLTKSGQYEYRKEVQGILKRILRISGASNYDFIMKGRKASAGETSRLTDKEALYKIVETNIYTLVRFCFATGNESPEKVNFLLRRSGFREISRCEEEYSRLDFFLNYLYRVADIDIMRAGKRDNGWTNLAVGRRNYDYFHHPVFEDYWYAYETRSRRI